MDELTCANQPMQCFRTLISFCSFMAHFGIGHRVSKLLCLIYVTSNAPTCVSWERTKVENISVFCLSFRMILLSDLVDW